MGTIVGSLLLANLVFGSQPIQAYDRGTDQHGSPIVVDGKGRTIGTFSFVGRMSVPSSSVLLEIQGTWYLLPFSRTGFASTGVHIFYADENCKGVAYIAAYPDDPVQVPQASGSVGIANGFLYYPKPDSVKPFSKVVVKSQRMLNFQAKDVGCGRIRTVMPPAFVGEMTTVDLSKLGFDPPFTLTEREENSNVRKSSKTK
jgi:hypothetical protein